MAFIRSALLLVACALLSCAATGPGDRPDRLPKATGKCLRVADIRQFKALDNYRLLVYTRRQTWLIETSGYCSSLRFLETIQFSSNDGRVCDYRMDDLIARDERCSVGSIRPYVDPTQEQLEKEIEEEPQERED